MLFTYDQARDGFAAKEILSGNLKLTCPPTDIPTLFHGPLFYYFLAFPSLFTNGDPRAFLLAMIMANTLTLIPLSVLFFKSYKSKFVIFLSLVFFAISFEMTSYARWVSNPGLVIPFFAIWTFGLATNNWPLIALGLGLCIQSQFFMIYLLPLTAIYYFVFNPGNKRLLSSVAILAVILSSFFLTELKFKFQGLIGLFKFFFTENTGHFNLASRLSHYFESLAALFTNNLIPQWPTVSILLGVTLVIAGLRSKIGRLGIFLLAGHFLVFIVSNTMHIFIGVGMGIAIILLLTNFINILVNKSKALALLFFLAIFFANFRTIYQKHAIDQISLFKVQRGMILKNQISLIANTYELSKGQKFSINASTNPYRYPTAWAYLYNWYSSSKKLDLPFYRGLTAYSFAGQNIFPMNNQKIDHEFLIVEPEVGAWGTLSNKVIEDEKTRHKLKEELKFGQITLLVF